MTDSTPQSTSLQHEIGKRRPFEHPEEEASLNLVRSASILEMAHTRFFRGYGLSSAAYNVLRILRGSGENGRTCSEISADLVTQGPDTTRLVDRLIKKSLVERERSETDRRIVRVRLTDMGRQLLSQIDEPLIELAKAQFVGFTPAELCELNRLLVKARSNTTS